MRQAPAFKRGMKFVTDETGRRMAIPFSVQHIVTLAPDLTETVYALGLEDKLVGDTTFCDTPPAAKLKPHVGSPQTPNLEAIVAMHPDLVLATTSINRRGDRGRAAAAGHSRLHQRSAYGARDAGFHRADGGFDGRE